jgi:multidrug efflux system membrane fusion protein
LKALSYLLVIGLAVLPGCQQEARTPVKPRAVRVITVGDEVNSRRVVYAGEVRPRFESKLGFRVGGKVLARQVDVGDQVNAGALLAELDPDDLSFARAAAEAQLAAARSDYKIAAEELERYRDLLDRRLISPAEFDRRASVAQAAASRAQSLEALLKQAANQVSHTRLVTAHAGIVTAVAVEKGQVVAAGQPVVTLARTDEREVSISVPEQDIHEIRKDQPASVTLLAEPGRSIKARIREISKSADPGSRTYSVRVSLLEPSPSAELGMTARVAIEVQGARAPVVPLSALYEPKNAPGSGARVWLFDPETRTVKSMPVGIERVINDERVELSGLRPGQQIVTAGVHRLREGEEVRIMGDETPVRARARSRL